MKQTIFFGSLVPHVWDQWTTGVGSLNHPCVNPVILRILPKTEISTYPTARFLVATQFIQCYDLQRKNVGSEMQQATM